MDIKLATMNQNKVKIINWNDKWGCLPKYNKFNSILECLQEYKETKLIDCCPNIQQLFAKALELKNKDLIITILATLRRSGKYNFSDEELGAIVDLFTLHEILIISYEFIRDEQFPYKQIGEKCIIANPATINKIIHNGIENMPTDLIMSLLSINHSFKPIILKTIKNSWIGLDILIGDLNVDVYNVKLLKILLKKSSKDGEFQAQSDANIKSRILLYKHNNEINKFNCTKIIDPIGLYIRKSHDNNCKRCDCKLVVRRIQLILRMFTTKNLSKLIFYHT